MSAYKMLNPKPAATNRKLPDAITSFQIRLCLAEQLELLSWTVQ